MVTRAPFTVIVRPQAEAELEELRAFEHRRIVEALEANLVYDATSPSRNRKKLGDIIPGFDFTPPLWQLKVGEFRVFYDVDDNKQTGMCERFGTSHRI